MATPKEVLKLWCDGDISTGYLLRQFFTDHLCGCSIPRRIKSWVFVALVFLADNCGPWFARKRLLNLVLGREIYYDFLQTDHVIQHDSAFFPSVTCLKW
jgi:hypothetical protein